MGGRSQPLVTVHDDGALMIDGTMAGSVWHASDLEIVRAALAEGGRPPAAPDGLLPSDEVYLTVPRLPTIYVASKSLHGPQWQSLREGIADRATIVSTWIDESGPNETADFADLWRRCIEEASAADVTVAIHYPGEQWKGAYIEIGAALASGKPVVVLGDPPGSFGHGPGIHRLPNDRAPGGPLIMPGIDYALSLVPAEAQPSTGQDDDVRPAP